MAQALRFPEPSTGGHGMDVEGVEELVALTAWGRHRGGLKLGAEKDLKHEAFP